MNAIVPSNQRVEIGDLLGTDLVVRVAEEPDDDGVPVGVVEVIYVGDSARDPPKSSKLITLRRIIACAHLRS